MDATRGLRYVPGLDGLRGLAVIAVVAFHADRLRGGFLGVDLFFVLSGFLITSLLLAEHGSTGHIGLRAFWGRRARRLLPALLVVLTAVLVVTLLVGDARDLARLRADGLATLFYVANWEAIRSGADYWAHFGSPSPLRHTWSLGIEEQFYLLFPLVAVGLLVLLGRRRPALGLGAACAVLAAISVGLLVHGELAGVDRSRLYLGTDTRMASILIGAGLACAIGAVGHVPAGRPRRLLEAVAAVALVGLVVSWFVVDGQQRFVYAGGLALLALGAAAVIAAVTHPDPGPVHRVLAWRPLVAVGLVSYGLYLWHWPVFVFLDRRRVGLDGLPLLAVQLAVTAALTVASYHLVEQPIRQRRLPSRPALGLAVSAVAVLTLCLIAAPTLRPPTDVSAWIRAPSTSVVRDGADTRPARILLVGDSVGASLGEVLEANDERLGLDLRNLAAPGCGVSAEVGRIRYANGQVGVESVACADVLASWDRELDGFHPDATVVVVGWPGDLDREFDGTWYRPCDQPFASWYESQVQLATHRLERTGVPLYLTLAPPADLSSVSAERQTDVACINRVYRDVAARDPAITLIDLGSHVCPGGRCPDGVEAVDLRPDGLHFSARGAATIGSWLVDEVMRDQAGRPT